MPPDGQAAHRPANGNVDVTHELVLAADRTLVRYKLEVPGQTIEAWRDGDSNQVKASAGGQSQGKTSPFTAATVVADNLVSAHLQLVLDRVAASSDAIVPMTVLVPQVMAAIPGKVTKGAEESATLNGKAIRVRKYSFEVANVLEEMWAEVGTNSLMQVTVPMQQVEVVREGFALAPAKAPVLLLQGGMDVQVLRADYDLALQALASKPPAMREARFFPTLNHLVMPVEGRATGAEYGRASHVSPEVIQIIAKWVDGRR